MLPNNYNDSSKNIKREYLKESCYSSDEFNGVSASLPHKTVDNMPKMSQRILQKPAPKV